MKYFYLVSALILTVVTSCSKRSYAPALYQHDVSYLPRPASFDSANNATYISLGGGFNQAVNINNTVSFAELDVSEGHTFGNVNLSYGAYGSLGSINNDNYEYDKNETSSFGSKSFGIVGARAAFNFYKEMDNVNFRFFGVEASYSREFGDFAAYRRQVSVLPDFYAITRTEMLTIGGTTEVLWHSPNNKNTQHALRAFVGKTLGNFDQVSTETSRFAPNIPVYFAMSYFAKFDRFWGAAELTKNDISIPGIRLKLGYKF